MKAKVFFIAIFVLFTNNFLSSQEVTPLSPEAQKWSLSNITFSAGRSSLVSGPSFSFLFSKNNSSTFVALSETLQEVVYDYSINKWISVEATGGFFYNVPWGGPAVSFKFFNNHFTTMHWLGWSLGSPEKGKIDFSESMFIFSYHQAKYSSKYFEGSYVLLHYEDDAPVHYFGTKVKVHFTDKTMLFGSVSYKYPAKETLFLMGISINL